jgi:predicted RNA binding protein YcfA (HicA-like mRNA interferase family)
VTCGELKRWLRKQGCRFVEGRRHTKVILKGRVTVLPRHAAVEMKTGTVQEILKALGLKGE